MKKSIKIDLGKDQRNKKFIIRGGDQSSKIETIQCEIIGYDSYYKEYLFLIPEDVRGFTISDFHILYYNVNNKHRGKRFNTLLDQ